jgi:hypothetical protein
MSKNSDKKLASTILQRDAFSPTPHHHALSANDDPVDVKAHLKLFVLDHRSLFLKNAVLIATISINLGWIA